MKLPPIKKYLFSVLLTSLITAAGVAKADNLIFKAIAEGNQTALKASLETTTDIEGRNSQGDTPLLAAARSGNLVLMALLLRHGADINALDSTRRDILNIAISQGNSDMVRWALDNNIDPTMVTSVYSGSALIYACHQGQVEIVAMLIDAGAPLDRVNNLGWTALLETTILGDGSAAYQKIASLLVRAGADKTIADRDGKTPLAHARARSHTKVAAILEN